MIALCGALRARGWRFVIASAYADLRVGIRYARLACTAILCFMLLVTPFAVLSASLHPDLSQAKAVRLPLRARTKQARRRPELKTLFVAASAARGERFYSACAGCHTPGRNQPHGVGPNL